MYMLGSSWKLGGTTQHLNDGSEKQTYPLNFRVCMLLKSMYIVVDKSTGHIKPHLICFLPQYQLIKKMFFQSMKKSLCDTLTRAALSGLLLTVED